MNFKKSNFVIILLCMLIPSGNLFSKELMHVPGLINISTSLSTGRFPIEKIVESARDKGVQIVFTADSYTLKMEYGIPPLRNLIKKTIEAPSINTIGIQSYLNRLKELNERFSDIIIVPGTENIPFYYWTGSPFLNNLTIHNWEKSFLIFGLENPDDYKNLPLIHNAYSTKYTIRFLPGTVSLFLAFLTSIFLIRWRGIFRILGVLILISSLLFLVNYHPFRSSLFDQYSGDQSIVPYQEVIDDVNSKNGLIFWSQPKESLRDKKIGPILLKDDYNPEDLLKSYDYTGFVILPDNRYELISPGGQWDTLLKEYSLDQRNRPVWQIGATHSREDPLENIDAIHTVFIIEKRDKKSVLEALRKGRTYTKIFCKEAGLSLNQFSVSDPKTETYGITGEDISTKGSPLINISLSATRKNSGEIKVNLIRSGKIISTFKGESPLHITYKDDYFKEGEKIYYRLDIKGGFSSRIITNPIFVKFSKGEE